MRVGGALERAVVLKWFYSLSRRKTFVEGKCSLPSALLVIVVIIIIIIIIIGGLCYFVCSLTILQ